VFCPKCFVHSNGLLEKDDGVSKRIRSPRIRDQVIIDRRSVEADNTGDD